MVEPELPVPDDQDSSIADAGALFHEAPVPSRPDVPAVADTASESYTLEPAEEGDSPRPRRIELATGDERPSRQRESDRRRQVENNEATSSAAVTKVWSRSAEWGPTMLRLVIAAIAAGCCVSFLLSIEEFTLAFVAMILGGVSLALLSYPILITLERPVRVTPEQAVRDYFGALSHHRPHFRRMWLLLSDTGKYGGSFATFDGFRRYWTRRLTELQNGRASAMTPLKFVVTSFRSEKSAGRTELQASYVVEVYVRGRQAEGPVERFELSAQLVKGPDRMWYLNRGTLP
ncbi:MAG: hypothetical protein U0794_05370 [Isosphaeraceae bacterium]